VVGAAGTLWRRDPVIGGLCRYMYETIAVASIGAGGPYDQGGGGTLRGTISDRLGHNLIFLMLTTLVVATIEWGGAVIGSLGTH
jgi:hypothetical protein